MDRYREFIAKAQENGALVTVAADILSLALLTPPGELGADIAVGSSQRFGVPLGYGGPHAAYFATKDANNAVRFLDTFFSSFFLGILLFSIIKKPLNISLLIFAFLSIFLPLSTGTTQSMVNNTNGC